MTVTLSLSSSQSAQGQSSGAAGFIPNPQPARVRPMKNSGLFSGRLGNSGSGNGKPDKSSGNGDDDDSTGGIPQCPKVESVEASKQRVANIDHHIRNLEAFSDSNKKSEKDQCQKNSQKKKAIRVITAHNGVEAILTDKSANHLTSKHGHDLGIDDPVILITE